MLKKKGKKGTFKGIQKHFIQKYMIHLTNSYFIKIYIDKNNLKLFKMKLINKNYITYIKKVSTPILHWLSLYL